MTEFRVVRKNRAGRIVADIGDRRGVVLEEGVTRGFERMMALRGWTPQQAFDHLMATRFDRPWHVPFRMGRLMARRRILEDISLGSLRVERLNNGELRAYRKVEGQFSTAFVAPPRSWYEHLDHVYAGQGPREVSAATEVFLMGLLLRVPGDKPPE